MNKPLHDFAESFKQHIEGIAAAKSENKSIESFTDAMCGYMQESGELDGFEVIEQFKRIGIQLNGYAIHEDEERLAVDLFVCLHTRIIPPISIHKNEWEPVIKRGIGFLRKCLSGLHYSLVRESEVYGISKMIHDNKEKIKLARIFFFTDGITKTIALDDVEVEGIPISFHVWDLERLFRMKSSGRKKEPIFLNLEQKYGLELPCLPMPETNEDYESFLAFIPGQLLARIYEEYGERLIERNVRSFLQFRGVNKEIRKTVLKEPHMFLAYNNGIAATAEQVDFGQSTQSGLPVIKSIKDLQIVNGGQTTAAIYHAAKNDKNADISKVYVQMKLTVIKDTEKMDEMVPIISLCANSQNKIQTADFFSNSPYHRKVEHFSRNEWAPAKAGSHRQSKWFYERARGQYLDLKNKQETKAKKRLFDEDHPKSQVFTKTDLAKYINSWEQLPHIVSRGNQKNFAEFSKSLDDLDVEQLDKSYYCDTIAKAIIFNTIYGMVKTQFRANIVTYTMAWLSYKTQQKIDLEEIWRMQSVPASMIETIKIVIKAAFSHISNPPNGENPTEWCKKEECWTSFRDMDIETFLEL
ncbi:AIPR family protein [Paenibacillus sp. OSY-SE]|uniref:AIPR family protein n=1 Tax=Paenibacillus sp. OSY-SE TaxID=1196323 RepID=UPI00030721B8|nr:AIPR family protein [Paenibacillus sp. OSY-SE]